jgi:hypothetical protein
VDGLSDIGAFHPYGLNIIKQITSMGFDRVLRGDESFGWQAGVHSYAESESEVGIRCLDKLKLYSELLRPQYFRMWSEAGAAAIDRVRSEVRDMEANDAKDYLYFTQRLQCYLNTAAYYKQVFIDHRTPLLDDAILDFLSRVPWQLRINKKLFTETVLAAYPDLWEVPVASNPGRENWEVEMVSPSPLRAYVEQQLNDSNSGIWEYFSRTALRHLFESFSDNCAQTIRHRIKGGFHDFSRNALSCLLPRVASGIKANRARANIPAYHAIFRFLVFKHWHDTFFSCSATTPLSLKL